MLTKEKPWRLIHSPPAPGAWNMAVDEAILEAVAAGSAPPTLRFYSWMPACLSIGYGQTFLDVDVQALHKQGWDIVRRPTGGKAILHTDELTYAICAPAEHPLMRDGILPSYKEISIGLMNGLEILSVPAANEEMYDLPQGSNPKGPVCFEIPSNWEITHEGKKLIGSAQVRRRGGVLQHGTLPLRGDLRRILSVLSFSDEKEKTMAGERLLQRATTVETAIQRRIEWADAAAAMTTGIAKTLNISFQPANLEKNEEKRAFELVEEKYSNSAWTKKR